MTGQGESCCSLLESRPDCGAKSAFPPRCSLGSQSDQAGTENAEVRYLIVAEDPRGNFTINAKTGEIKPHAVLEYEKIPSTAQAKTFNLTVQGFDLGSPSLSSDMTVVIYLVGKNNNLPVFSRLQYSVTIPEDTPGLTLVLQHQVGGSRPRGCAQVGLRPMTGKVSP